MGCPSHGYPTYKHLGIIGWWEVLVLGWKKNEDAGLRGVVTKNRYDFLFFYGKRLHCLGYIACNVGVVWGGS